MERAYSAPAMRQPGDARGQRAVLAATLEVLATARTPGTLVRLPFVWPQTPGEARDEPEQPAPIVVLIKRKPWLYLKLLSGDIPEPNMASTPPQRPHGRWAAAKPPQV
jgi:hypothetical protein